MPYYCMFLYGFYSLLESINYIQMRFSQVRTRIVFKHCICPPNMSMSWSNLCECDIFYFSKGGIRQEYVCMCVKWGYGRILINPCRIIFWVRQFLLLRFMLWMSVDFRHRERCMNGGNRFCCCCSTNLSGLESSPEENHCRKSSTTALYEHSSPFKYL